MNQGKNNDGFRIIIVNIYSSDGGPIVLSVLCKVLRELGYDTSIYITSHDALDNKSPALKRILKRIFIFFLLLIRKVNLLSSIIDKFTPTSLNIENVKYKLLPFFNKDNTIVLYPDVIYGNPLNAKYVIRWLLYHSRYTNTNQYSDKDLFIAYRKIFNNKILNPKEYIVTLGYFNNKVFKQYNFGNRYGNCYLLRKGKDRRDLPTTFDGPVFDNIKNDREWVKILNNREFCYSYDTQSFYNKIAAVCGCIPVVILEPNKNIKDYLGPEEKHYGIAYGNNQEQIEYAINTRQIMLENLDYTKSNIENVCNFVAIIEQEFGELCKISK